MRRIITQLRHEIKIGDGEKVNKKEHERYNQQIRFLEKQNRILLEELSKVDLLKPRVISINKWNVCLDEIIADENKRLKLQLQTEQNSHNALRERLKEDMYFDTNFNAYSGNLCIGCGCSDSGIHVDDCWAFLAINKREYVK